uniref:Uncharacterized protein n=1 Tax=Setaria italica TaxID=4555 RepID=K3ZGP0_SETIT
MECCRLVAPFKTYKFSMNCCICQYLYLLIYCLSESFFSSHAEEYKVE